jgi:hypothetical protein
MRQYGILLLYGYFIWITTESHYQPEAVNTANAARVSAAMIDHDTLRLLESVETGRAKEAQPLRSTRGVRSEKGSALPAGFEPLERFLSEWVWPDAVSRVAKRQGSTLAEIREFYDAMLPLGERALDYLRQFELGSVPPEGERLLELMLSLAEIAPAVEWYDGPAVRNGFPISRIRYLRQIPDLDPQR